MLQIPATDRELWQKLFVSLMHAVLRDYSAESSTSAIRPQLELLQLFAAAYRDFLRVPFGYLYCTITVLFVYTAYNIQFVILLAHIKKTLILIVIWWKHWTWKMRQFVSSAFFCSLEFSSSKNLSSTLNRIPYLSGHYSLSLSASFNYCFFAVQ